MDAGQLKNFLNNQVPHLDFAVTSADRLPTRDNFARPASLIVNTDPSTLPGEHWVCFYFPEKGPPEFFDSLGHHPEHYHPNFRNVLIVNGPDYLRNTERLQDYDSPYCGVYCLYYLVYRRLGEDFQSILNRFGDDYSTNDARVVEWLVTM